MNQKLSLLFIMVVLLILSLFSLRESFASNASMITVSSDRWPDCSSLKRFGDDCVRIADAQTNEEKAIAVWRFIQQITEAGSVPKEPAYDDYYVLSPLKLLNVYGVHWCDGLSRIMTMTWRSLGFRAEKLYKYGHTLADCWWQDLDGIERWHVFDLSQHWFVYDRAGNHIATKDELALDHSLIYFPSRTPIPNNPSLMQPSYVHAGHLNIKPDNIGINLRIGESIRFLWGNEGKPYYNLFGKGTQKDFEHGPYAINYGNGRLVYTPDLSQKNFLTGLYQKPDNLACAEGDSLKPALHPVNVNKTGSAIIQVALPYVISDVVLNAQVRRENPDDMIRFSFSVDNGRSWRSIWEAKKEFGVIRLEGINFCESFDPSREKKPDKITPFGRYDFLIKIEMKAGKDVSQCGLEKLSIVTVFQHNIFSLPMLWPGNNHITVRGSLDSQSLLKLTYLWEDNESKERKHVIETRTVPFEYDIVTQGKKWEDVVCRSLEVSVLPITQDTNKAMTSNSNEKKLSQSSKTYDFPVTKSIGTFNQKPLQSAEHYIRRLDILLRSQDDPRLSQPELKKLSHEIGQNTLALGALRDPKAKEILEQVIKRDRSSPGQNKIWACQALFHAAGSASFPVMVQVLERDKGIIWNDPDRKWSEDAMWLHTAGMAAAILSEIREFEGKMRAANLIAEILTGKQTQVDPKKLWRGEEICWGLIKALGKLGNTRHVPLLKKYLTEGSDATAVALLALKDIGDHSVIPELLYLLNHFEYSPVGLYTIEALGEMGTKDLGHYLYPFLNHWDEDFRGAAAVALGKMGDTKAVPRLQELLAKEHFPWIITAIKQSLQRLENTHKGVNS